MGKRKDCNISPFLPLKSPSSIYFDRCFLSLSETCDFFELRNGKGAKIAVGGVHMKQVGDPAIVPVIIFLPLVQMMKEVGSRCIEGEVDGKMGNASNGCMRRDFSSMRAEQREMPGLSDSAEAAVVPLALGLFMT